MKFLKRVSGALLSTAAGTAWAAGGHFDVDDATILPDGHCQVEAWLLQGRSPGLYAKHLGPACNWAGLEWGLNADGLRVDGSRFDSAGLQVKWVADPAAQRLSIGAAAAVNWHAQGDKRPFVTAYVPVTAWLGTDGWLQLHANLGQDRDPGAGSWRRWGMAGDCAVNDRLTLTLERRFQLGHGLTRAGLRWNWSPLVSTDLSVPGDAGTRVYALGLNWEWSR